MRALIALAAWAALGAWAGPALGCTVGVATQGGLGINGSGDTLSSENVLSGGLVSVLTVTNGLFDPAYTVFVSAPSLVPPPGYHGTPTVLVAYTAAGVGVAKTQPMTASATSFDAPAAALAVVLTLQSRIVSPDGFASGAYQSKVTVTCAPQ
ncbi:MAG TPA: hypothetical protein VHA07_13900 [Devosia sp.]|nr:hypothetical protein [Devosia sp.]